MQKTDLLKIHFLRRRLGTLTTMVAITDGLGWEPSQSGCSAIAKIPQTRGRLAFQGMGHEIVHASTALTTSHDGNAARSNSVNIRTIIARCAIRIVVARFPNAGSYNEETAST